MLYFKLDVIKPFHLIGYSMGGIIVSKFAGTYPKKIKSLTLVCTAGTRAANHTGLLPTYIDFILQFPILNTFMAKWLHLQRYLFGHPDGTDWDSNSSDRWKDYVKEEKRRLKEEPGLWRSVLLSLRGMPIGVGDRERRPDLFHTLGTCTKIPKFIIMGDKDRYCPGPESIKEFKKMIPGIKTILLKGAAHDVFIEHAEMVCDHIIKFQSKYN